MCDPQFCQQLISPFRTRSRRKFHGFENSHQVFRYRQFPEHRRFLGQITDTVSSPQIHGHFCDIDSVKNHPALVWSYQSYHHIERRRFTRPVRPQETYYLSIFYLKTDAPNDFSSAVTFLQFFCFKSLHIYLSLTPFFFFIRLFLLVLIKQYISSFNKTPVIMHKKSYFFPVILILFFDNAGVSSKYDLFFPAVIRSLIRKRYL